MNLQIPSRNFFNKCNRFISDGAPVTLIQKNQVQIQDEAVFYFFI